MTYVIWIGYLKTFNNRCFCGEGNYEHVLSQNYFYRNLTIMPVFTLCSYQNEGYQVGDVISKIKNKVCSLSLCLPLL